MTYNTKGAALVACMLAIGVAWTLQSAFAQVTCMSVPPPQQTALIRPIMLGTSGGNNHSIHQEEKRRRLKGCFSGTLGSMVQDSTNNQYILSNNHVLADQNLAKPGEPIVQPGLVDVQCVRSQSNAVATFSSAVKHQVRTGRAHKNFVDAAIAAVEPGDVSPQILFIGNIASTDGQRASNRDVCEENGPYELPHDRSRLRHWTPT